jgi:hypothetical protein
MTITVTSVSTKHGNTLTSNILYTQIRETVKVFLLIAGSRLKELHQFIGSFSGFDHVSLYQVSLNMSTGVGGLLLTILLGVVCYGCFNFICVVICVCVCVCVFVILTFTVFCLCTYLYCFVDILLFYVFLVSCC